ncbi:YggS family pyridoxal phosphate-dependent enzyme [Phragmitibacter flavus]|uniref:Pyridoxal phosphate homeostasis protein n=1 Tax=Phragmitibacter flavus TaxID=2576071 RepID=A0A5R8K9Z3_9BACT|nr:YggS family pyridoxal phosphate-dependent enzyme [Phragmitibacter flavus]TLD69152.1 YggS family pyridoxal phosphate-dependent enzyme [Phragmitibacter flavus]
MYIHENLKEVQLKIAEAAMKSHRLGEEVELLVVSKTFDADRVREVVEAGQRLFGENRVQEMLAKVPLLPDSLRWHLIGHLQSNKVRKVLPVVEALHGIDSVAIARDVQRIAGELGLFPKVYLEVNVAGEASKFGFTPEGVEAELEELLELDRIELVGLMCVPPVGREAEDSRRYFVKLRELRDRLELRGGVKLPGLSMGMSGDYAVAVEEGATVVRVGSAIFGRRG